MHSHRAIFLVSIFLVGALSLPSFFPPSLSWAQEEEPYGIKFGSLSTFAEFHGFLNVRYFDFEREGLRAKPDASPGTSTLDVHNLYIVALAKIHPRVTLFGEVEYEHAGKDEIDQQIAVDRAFIDWIAIDPYLTLRIGSFNPPIGYELAEYVAPIRKFESRPFYVDTLLYHEWVDVGLWAKGQLKTPVAGILYDLSLLNGPRGLTENDLQNRDNNSNRTFLGRVAFAPNMGNTGYAEVGFSYATGKYIAENEFRIWVIDARYQAMGLDLRGEYAKRSGDAQTLVDPNGNPVGTIFADAEGFYLQASYRVLQGWKGINYIEPAVRYDRSDILNSDPSKNDEFSRVTFGINYSPFPHLSFKTEYQFIREEKADLDNDGFMIAAVADF